MKLLLLILLVPSVISRDLPTMKALMKKQDYPAVISLADKYPSLFRSATERGWLALSHAKEGQFADATYHCRLALEIENLTACREMLKSIRSREPGLYRLGTALYLIKTADYRKSMDLLAQHLLDEKIPEETRAREELLSVLKRGTLYHLMDEVIRTSPRKTGLISAYEKEVQSFVIKTRFWLKRKESLNLQEDGEFISMMTAISGENEFDMAARLASFLQSEMEQNGFQEHLALRLARLLIATGSIQKADEYVGTIEGSIGTPIHRFSLKVLKEDISRLLAKKSGESLPQPEEGARKVIDVAKALPKSAMAGLPVAVETTSTLNLTPLDFSELELATPSDLSPYKRIIEAYDKRMAQNPSEYEKRFLFKELDDAYYDLRDGEKTTEAFHAWLNTSEAQDFVHRVNEMEKEFLKVDQINAKAFEGEADRFAMDLSKANTQDQKLRVLSNYAGKWDKLVFGKNTNLFVQGAAVAYRDTDEGRRVAKMVYDLVQELKLLPDDMYIPPDFLEERDW